jgi:hypothetical protein
MVYIEDPVSYDSIRPGLYFYLPYLQDLILQLSFKPPQLWASWPVPLRQVGRLMVGLYLRMPTPRNGRVVHHAELLSWADSFHQGTY